MLILSNLILLISNALTKKREHSILFSSSSFNNSNSIIALIFAQTIAINNFQFIYFISLLILANLLIFIINYLIIAKRNQKFFITVLIFTNLTIFFYFYGLGVISFLFKGFKLLEKLYALFMEGESSSKGKQKASSPPKSPNKKGSPNFSSGGSGGSGGGSNDDEKSKNSSNTKKRKRSSEDECDRTESELYKSPKKQKTLENDDLSPFFSDNNPGDNDSNLSESENSSQPVYQDKGKGKYVPEDIYVAVPGTMYEAEAWLTEDDLEAIKYQANEFVKNSDYEVFLSIDNNEYSSSIKAFDDLVDQVKDLETIPLEVKTCIANLAWNAVYYSEVVEFFLEKYKDMP